ncbi:MAG: ABC transporter permease, partial [Thiohalospira sp.]
APAALAGVAVWAVAAGVIAASRGLLAGYAALFLVLVGFALVTPWLMARALPALGRGMSRLGVVPRLAAGGVATSLTRTAPAVVALAVAVSATVGVGTMVDSFRGSLQSWLGEALQADVYVTSAARRADGTGADLPPAAVERVSALDGVARATTSRAANLELAGREVELFAVEAGATGLDGFPLTAGDPEAVEPAWRAGEGVLVSEPLARRHGLAPGDTLAVPTPAGEAKWTVLGVFRDYGSEQGVIAVDRARYRERFDDPGVGAVGLHLAEGVDPEGVVAAAREAVADWPALEVTSNRAVREASLAVFDRTFAITHVLRLLAVGVAFMGILSALLAWQLERGRELGLLRAVGLDPGQARRLVATETGLLGLAAGLLALPLGIALAGVLVHVINRRAFGWTMELNLPPDVLVEGVVLAVVAALLAGIVPARRAARLAPARLVREE